VYNNSVMTATNHMLTGAVIAAAVRQPLLVVPLAFLSHFILDMFPHFGVAESDSMERNKHPLFRAVLTLDLVVLFAALIAVPLFFDTNVPGWVLLLGMLSAWVPDIVWIAHFYHDHKGHERKRPTRLTRFHQKIQWFERPPGIVTEVIWFAGSLTLLAIIAS
jgi:hypothetical protein